MKTYVQQIMLGTMTGSEEAARATLRRVKAAGYEGLELNRFMTRPAGLLVRLLTKAAGMPTGRGGKLDWPRLMGESGLETVSYHADLGSLEREPAVVAAEAKALGTDKVVITGMYRFDYGSEGAVKDLARRLNEAGAALKRQGLSLLYHNHNAELLFVQPNVRSYDILIDETDAELVNFEFDSYWFAEAGADPKIWMRRLGSRMQLWHVTDRGSRQNGLAMTPILPCDSMELGTGNMDLAGMRDIALENGVRALILESHKNWVDKDPVRSLELSAEYLKGWK